MFYHPFWWDTLQELLRENVTVLLNNVTQFFPVAYRYTIEDLMFSFSNTNKIFPWALTLID